ncbi:MAG: hypothetical protein IJX18_01795 [Clostridia bacterium]|nr:hypothetical protein [Clostridia bacterium]
MTNLEYLNWFLTDTYGAICFHNDEKDGYRLFPKEQGKEMETLSVYFPNRLDLEDETVCERLTNAAGEKFYERYVGAKGVRLCRLNGSLLLVRFVKDGQTLGITVDNTMSRLAGGVRNLIDYFIGNEISEAVLDRPNNFRQSIPTNNDFCIETGENIQEKVESYLLARDMPIVSKSNGFYVAETLMEKLSDGRTIKYNSMKYIEEIQKYFSLEMQEICSIRKAREDVFRKLLTYMSEADKNDFNNLMGLDREPIKRSSEFDD